MKRLFVFLLILIGLTGLFSCKREQPAPPEEVFLSVSFSTTLLPYAAATPATQSVKAGECAEEPVLAAEPTAGYVVIWTSDPSSRTPYDFSRPVEGDLLLYAAETPRTYHVTYLTERGAVPASARTSFTKETPTFSLKEVQLDADEDFGYRFLYWSYFDDPSAVVNEIAQGTEGDVVLRAYIVPVTYDIYYKEAGDVSSLPKKYVYGEQVSLGVPLREGYRFIGWTIYADRQRTPVTTLDAAFVKAHRKALFRGNGSGIGLEANWEVAQ